MSILTLDFETFYGGDYTLSKMTTEAYVRDPRFEMILCAVKIDEAPAFWLLPERFQQFVDEEVDWENTTLICHHAHFDGLILSHHYNWRPAFWLDTLSMARVVDGPKAKNDLESLCIRHGIGQKGDYVRFAKGKHLADFSRDELKQYGAYSCNDAEKTYKLAQIYIGQIPEFMLQLQDLKIRMFTEPVFIGDKELLAQAVEQERTRKAALLDAIGVNKDVLSSNDKFAALLESLDEEVPMKPSPSANGTMIPAFAKSDAGMQELLEHDDELIRAIAEARLAVKSTIIETRAQKYLGCAQRGWMPVYLKPNGAHTHRSSAGDGMNWQNLTSINKKRPEMTVLKRSIMAPKYHKVVAVDSAQIQARLTAWVAGQQDKVEAFAAGRDLYSEFATLVYRRLVDRKRKVIVNGEETLPDFIPGQVGKICELGYGFGMGWLNSAKEFLKGALGAPPIQFVEKDIETMGIEAHRFLNNPYKIDQVERMISRLDMTDRLIHCIVTEYLVNLWRARNPYIAGSDEIKGLWDTMETAIDAMIEGREFVFGPGGILRTEKDGLILPSGMKLRYRDIQRDEHGQASYWNGRKRAKIYGGYATENVIQALEQEIIGPQMLEISQAGLKVATENYDSVVTVVPDDTADDALKFMIQVLKTAPGWAKGLPLNAEGGIGTRYGDCK